MAVSLLSKQHDGFAGKQKETASNLQKEGITWFTNVNAQFNEAHALLFEAKSSILYHIYPWCRGPEIKLENFETNKSYKVAG